MRLMSSCLWKAEGERVEFTIVVDEKMIWSGTLAKEETQTINIPERAFTVCNASLKTMGECPRGLPYEDLQGHPTHFGSPVLFGSVVLDPGD